MVGFFEFDLLFASGYTLVTGVKLGLDPQRSYAEVLSWSACMLHDP